MNPNQLAHLIGFILDGDIVITSSLGEGGMGTVYRAHQRVLNRDVCVKFMLPNLVSSGELLQRFQREGKILSRLQNPHVIEVYSVGILQGVYPYLVMEFSEGVSLRKVLNEEGKLNWRRACEIAVQICDGLTSVHRAGFIHRDLKPDNVLLQESTENDFVKIIDFGLSGFSDQRSTVTETGDLLGSVFYMAPESFSQPQKSASVDVYSLGCMLFECLAGEPPFGANTVAGMAYRHMHDDIPQLPDSIADSNVREFLQAIIGKSCAKDPRDRFTDCREIEKYLRQVLRGDMSKTSVQSLLTPSPKNENHRKRVTSLIVAALMVFTFAASILCFHSKEISRRIEQCAVVASCYQRQMFHDEKGLLDDAQRAFDSGNFGKSSVCWQSYLSQNDSDRLPGTTIAALLSLAQSDLHLSKNDDAAHLLTRALRLVADALVQPSLNSDQQTFANLSRAISILHRPVIPIETMSPMATLFSANLPGADLDAQRKALTVILKCNRLKEQLKLETALALSELDWEKQEYLNSLVNVASVVSSGADRRIIEESWRKQKLEPAGRAMCSNDFRIYFSQLCLDMAGYHQTRKELPLAALYLRLLRLTDRDTSLSTSDLCRFVQLVYNCNYIDDIEPSIWEVMHYKKRRARSASHGSINWSDVNFFLDGMACQQARRSGVDVAHALHCLVAEDSLESAILLVKSYAEKIRELIRAHDLTASADELNALLSSKTWKVILDAPPHRKTLIANLDGEESIECAIEEWLVAASSGSGEPRVQAQQDKFFRAWHTVARKYYSSKNGLHHYGYWLETAVKSNSFGSLITEDDKLYQLIAADQTVTMEKRCYIGDLLATRLVEQGLSQQAVNVRRATYGILMQDQSSERPSLTIHEVVDYPEHLLNLGLVSEALSLSNLLDKRAVDSKDVRSRFFQGLWGFRVGVAARDGEKIRRSRVEIVDALSKLKGPATPYDRKMAKEILRLVETGQRRAGISVLRSYADTILRAVQKDSLKRPRFRILIELYCAMAQMDVRKERFSDAAEDCVSAWVAYVYSMDSMAGKTFWKELPPQMER